MEPELAKLQQVEENLSAQLQHRRSMLDMLLALERRHVATLGQCGQERQQLQETVTTLQQQLASVPSCGLTKQELTDLEARGQATLDRYDQLIQRGTVAPEQLQRLATMLGTTNADLQRELETIKERTKEIATFREHREQLLRERGQHNS